MAGQFEKQVGAGADQVAQVNPAITLGQCDEVVDDGFDSRDRPPHLGKPRGAEFSQCDLAGVPREEDDAEVVLERLDRGGQRRLRDEQLLRRAPIVQLFAEYGEVAKLAQCDVGGRRFPLLAWSDVAAGAAPVSAPREAMLGPPVA